MTLNAAAIQMLVNMDATCSLKLFYCLEKESKQFWQFGHYSAMLAYILLKLATENAVLS